MNLVNEKKLTYHSINCPVADKSRICWVSLNGCLGTMLFQFSDKWEIFSVKLFLQEWTFSHIGLSEDQMCWCVSYWKWVYLVCLLQLQSRICFVSEFIAYSWTCFVCIATREVWKCFLHYKKRERYHSVFKYMLKR